MARGTVLLSMKGINKIYEMGENSLHVLHDVDFEVREGEFGVDTRTFGLR